MTIKTILVATDFSEPSVAALAYGRELAGRFGATLHVLHVAQNVYVSTLGAESYATIAPGLQQQIEDDARRALDELVAGCQKSGPPTVGALLTSSTPAFEIVDYAKAHDVDLIVMGTHGRGALAHLIMGSVAERVVRLAPCPVLTVRQPERDFVRPDAVVATAQA